MAQNMNPRLAQVLNHVHMTPVSASLPTYTNVLLEKHDRVAVITLNRPKQLNALNDELINDICDAIEYCNHTNEIGCIILTGQGKAFAAGADILEMSTMSYHQMSTHDKIEPWGRISSSKLPIIAAVNGIALGGGCEIAMMCDIILASSSAAFGQPEIKLGIIPGAGGTQRLTHAVGKSKAMEMILTGNPITADEALRIGLVSKVISPDDLMPEALKMAKTISSYSRPVVRLAKESVNGTYGTLESGLHLERRLFHSCFALDDQKEGMNAFINKRKPNFKHQ